MTDPKPQRSGIVEICVAVAALISVIYFEMNSASPIRKVDVSNLKIVDCEISEPCSFASEPLAKFIKGYLSNNQSTASQSEEGLVEYLPIRKLPDKLIVRQCDSKITKEICPDFASIYRIDGVHNTGVIVFGESRPTISVLRTIKEITSWSELYYFLHSEDGASRIVEAYRPEVSNKQFTEKDRRGLAEFLIDTRTKY